MFDWEKFTRVWQASGGVEEVARAMGMDRALASTYASRLRRRGVNLKKFGGSGFRRDQLERLKAIAEGVTP